MSEEEKKAIALLKEDIKSYKKEVETSKYKEDVKSFSKYVKRYTTILNLIEKLQKERDIYYYEWKTLEADLINNDIIPKDKIKKLIVTLGQHKNDKIDVTITYKDAIDTAITALGELLEEK